MVRKVGKKQPARTSAYVIETVIAFCVFLRVILAQEVLRASLVEKGQR